jgi:hypothetical protein
MHAAKVAAQAFRDNSPIKGGSVSKVTLVIAVDSYISANARATGGVEGMDPMWRLYFPANQLLANGPAH